jgi:spermidine synthase
MEEIKEFHSPTTGFFIKAKPLIKKKTPFQNLELYQHNTYGKILRLDGYFQVAESSEFFYHEPLVHPPLHTHPNPKEILVIGGGDGCSLKEILKHPINKVTLVELDKEVINVSKKHLYSINKNSFQDPRVEITIQDGFNFLSKTEKKFDVIVLDLTDAVGESKKLYTKEFYALVSTKLDKNGVLSLHIEQPLTYPKTFSRIYNTLKSVFKNMKIHSTFVPFYGTLITFGLCSQDLDFKTLHKRNIKGLKYFSPKIFKSSLLVPKYLKDLTNLDKRIITNKIPLKSLE